MKVDELLSNIESIARSAKISKPFLVGGVPRDRVIGKHEGMGDIKDLDITTGDDSAKKLAVLVAKKFPESDYRMYDDGHSSVNLMGLHLDFSSNFAAPNIKKELIKAGVKDIDSMKLELYSRDFTMNTLLESLDFSTIYDITGEGVGDIQAGIIKCPIDPQITIGVDPRRILRAIKFATKYGFKLDTGLKNAMRDHRKKIQSLPVKFVQDKISEIVRIDDDKGLEMLIEYKLLPLVPLTKTVSDILIQRRQLVKAL